MARDAPAGWADEWKAAFRAACAGVDALGSLSDRDLENLVVFDADRLAWDPEARPLEERLPRRLRLRAGEHVVHATGCDNAAYHLVEGTARVTDPDGPDGEETLRDVGAGEWVGEQAALLNIPRSADVVMTSDGVLLRVPATTFRPLYRRKLRGKIALGAGFERVAVEVTLRHQRDLRLVGREERRRLGENARLVAFDEGDVVCVQDGVPDFVYVVRTASVVVETVLWPARAVEVVGPLGMVGEVSVVLGGGRRATVRAEGDCELVAIPADDFRALLARDPEFAARMRRRAEEIDGGRRWDREEIAARNESVSARLARGGVVPRVRRGIDPGVCIRCRMCEDACAESHGGVPRLTIDEPEVAGLRDSSACSNCEAAFCESACNYAAITRTMDGQVEIDPDRCVGCKACVAPGTGCPYGSIQIVPLASVGRSERPSIARRLRRTIARTWFSLPWTRRGAEVGDSADGKEDVPRRATRVGVHGSAVDPTCAKRHTEPPRAVAVKCDLCRSVGGVEQCVASCPVDAFRLVPAPQP